MPIFLIDNISVCTCTGLNIIFEYLDHWQFEPNVKGLSCLLSAVMEALCHPTVKLSALMPREDQQSPTSHLVS